MRSHPVPRLIALAMAIPLLLAAVWMLLDLAGGL
jgi:hypothetical protein